MINRFTTLIRTALLLLGCICPFAAANPASAETFGALGPFTGIGDPGTAATPATVVTRAPATTAQDQRSRPRGYEVDAANIQTLKSALMPLSTSIEPTQNSAAPLQDFTPLAPAESVGFQGITYTGHFPPDNGIAAGPSHVLEMVNSSWRAFTKSGTPASGSNNFCGSGGWWTSKLPSGVTGCFDPHVIYDQFSGRWVMLAAAESDSLRGSWYLLATSFSSDPTGSWCTYALDATLDGSTRTNNWADFPALGLDGQAIYITSNQFSLSGSGSFQYVKLRIVGKQQLYNNTCQSPTWTDFTQFKDFEGNNAFTIIPAQTFGSPGAEFLVSLGSTSGSTMTLWTLTNPLSGATLTSANVPIGNYNLPPSAQQCGNATPLDTGDARLLNAVYRNGALWTGHTIACPGDNSKACLGLLRVSTATATVMDDFSYGSPTYPFHFFYPAVMTDAANNFYVVFNSSSTQQCPAIQYTGRPSTDPPNTLESYGFIKASSSSYVRLDSDGTNRWGDYSGIAADPAKANSVWMGGEYAATSSTWGTWIAQATFGTPPIADFDGDGRSDIGIYRDGAWSIVRSSDGRIINPGWGGPNWIPVTADYDGDGIADIAVYNSAGVWSIIRSSDGANIVVGWGGPGWIPVPADYDGDGKADIAVYNPAGVWSIIRSSDGGNTVVGWGGPGWQPVPADYDGDGKADIAVYNAVGAWSIIRSSDGGNTVTGWGGPSWQPVPADYDGDGKADIAVYNSAGSWSILRSLDGGNTVTGWGGPSWIPVPADYDGDGKADIAVYNSIGAWSIIRSSDGGNTVTAWGGAPQDIPLTRK